MFNILTEDGVFNITQEDGGAILQEFSGVSATITATPALSGSVTPSVSISALVQSRVVMTATALQAITVSATISARAVLFSAESKARSVSATISAAPSLSSVQSFSVNSSATITGRAIVSAVVGGVVTTSATISSRAILSATVQSTRPEPITSFRVTRSGGTASLSWVNGIRTAKVEIYRSVGVRANLTKIGESTGSTYSDSINSSETYSYQLIPIGNTGAQGEATTIIYTATDNVS